MKIKLSISGAAIVLMAAFIFLGSYYTDRLLTPFLNDFLEKNKPLKHNITYEKLRLNLVTRQVRIIGIKMLPDSALSLNEHVWMNVSVSSVKLTQFRIGAFLVHKKLIIGDLEFVEPSVILHLPKKNPEAVRDAAAESSAKKFNLASFKGLSLVNILLANGLFKLYQEDELIASSDNLDFLARDIHVKRGDNEKQIKLDYGESRISIKNILFHTLTSLYNFKAGQLQVSNTDSTIVFDNLEIVPKYGKTEFSSKLDFQNDRFDLDISQVRIEQVGYMQWLAGHPLEITRLLLDGVHADIYRDKNVAFNFDRYPLFYNESFSKLPFEMIIDSVMIINSHIQYGEMAENSNEAWAIRLEDFSLSTNNLRNLKDETGRKSAMLFKVQARVMDEGKLNVELDLPLEGNLRHFRCKGSVGTMELAPLNPMLEPAINMRLNGGTLTRMTFDFKADDNESNGWMEFLYQDLDVVILKKNPDKQWRFLSTLANTAVLSNNPQPGKDAKIVEIGYERDKNKGIINYIWKTIQSGLVRTIVPLKKHQIKRDSKNEIIDIFSARHPFADLPGSFSAG